MSKIAQKKGLKPETKEAARALRQVQALGKSSPVKWLRMEAAAAYSGLSRSTLYQAMVDGQLKSVLIRQKNSHIKGIRLISVDVLDAYIRSFTQKEFSPGFHPNPHPKPASK